jgi:quercetin dioxygenase-like cupin family protein
MSHYSVAKRDEAQDFMAEYEGFGEMLSYTSPLGTEQVAITWRRMPEGTGGKGSYGHSHKTQEEVVLVLKGNVQFKVGDDVFEAEPGTAVRLAPEAVRSIHNDGPGDAEVVLVSKRIEGSPADDTEMHDDFWPE